MGNNYDLIKPTSIDNNNNNNICTLLSNINITKNMFEFLYVIGRGGFGKVWKVVYKKTSYPFALKEMSKVKIIDRKSEKNILNERNVLAKLKHPFIINMKCAFQDKDYLYLLMDFLPGGDLRYHFCKHKRFNETQTKFFIACVLLSLEYVHSNAILHRDIKPENLVCDEYGYIHLTDFGVAKKAHRNNAKETSGTPGYMAPEVLCAKNHTYVVDFFAIGVMGYEFMLGRRPYLGKSRKEIKQQVLTYQAELICEDLPKGWSFEAMDFINKLLQRKPHKRLGINGIKDIKQHQWFIGFDWDALLKKKMNVPFVPKCGDNFDRKYCNGEDEEGTETQDRYKLYKEDESYGNIFANYTINNIREDDVALVCGNNFIYKSGQHCGSNSIHSTNTSSIKKTGTASSNVHEHNNSKNKSPQQSPTNQQQQHQQMYVEFKNRRIKRKGNTMNLYRDNSSGLLGIGMTNNSMNVNNNNNKNNKSQRAGNSKFLYESGNASNNMNGNGISLKKFKLNHNSINYCSNNRSNNMNCNIAIPSYRSHNNSGTISPLSPRNVKFTTELQNLPKIEYANKHNTKYNGLSCGFDNVNNSLSLRKTNSFINVFEHNKMLKQQKSFSPTAVHSRYELLSPKINRYTFIPKEELYANVSNNINSLMISNIKYNNNSNNIHKAKSIYNNSSQNKFLINYNP